MDGRIDGSNLTERKMRTRLESGITPSVNGTQLNHSEYQNFMDSIISLPFVLLTIPFYPFSMAPQKVIETIGRTLNQQYERWQPRLHDWTTSSSGPSMMDCILMAACEAHEIPP
ncbi:Uncharacterized protein Fot_06210 [Forsythia ovata]|uniref:Uncharacterized protein n=1 Tax=Forsythia ovata TaxID=205694 RepID=A0ABD1WSP9_9LAMI